MANSPLYLIFTVIGDDRPGLVGDLSTAVSAHHGNWLEASMSHLAGKFAGIVKVAVAENAAETLQRALTQLPGLTVACESSTEAQQAPARRLSLSLVGHDRIGIVREVTQALARHAANIEKIETHTGSAPMAAGILFYAEIELTAPASFDADSLQSDLERISNDLMVDIRLGETLRD